MFVFSAVYFKKGLIVLPFLGLVWFPKRRMIICESLVLLPKVIRYLLLLWFSNCLHWDPDIVWGTKKTESTPPFQFPLYEWTMTICIRSIQTSIMRIRESIHNSLRDDHSGSIQVLCSCQNLYHRYLSSLIHQVLLLIFSLWGEDYLETVFFNM